MDYQTFFTKFGGSFRTNHLQLTVPQEARRRVTRTPEAPAGPMPGNVPDNGGTPAAPSSRAESVKSDPAGALSRFARRKGQAATRALGPRLMTVSPSLTDTTTLLAASTRRPYRLPPPGPLPSEFIRLDPWEAEYLFLLAGQATQGVLETGRFHGGSTFLMSCANEQVPLWSIDIEPKNDQLLQGLLDENGVGARTDLIVGDSQGSKYEQIGEFDMLFVDGDHSYQGCTNDLENWYPDLARGGHVVVHDSYMPGEVHRSVVDFVNSHDVEVVRTPYIPSVHWQHPTGSLAHFIKRS